MATTHQPAASRSQRSLLAAFAASFEAVLWTFSAVALGLVVWMIGDAYLYQARARELVIGPGAAVEQAEGRAVRAAIPPGSPIARLSIPRLDVSMVVAEGTSSRVLRRAVGHLPATARLGEVGNMVIAGHRDTFFRPLQDIRTGDSIVLESGLARHTYRVEWTSVVDPEDVGVLAASKHPALTLVTCYPFRYVGNAPQRFIVRARAEPQRSSSRR
jgi:sortase A